MTISRNDITHPFPKNHFKKWNHSFVIAFSVIAYLQANPLPAAQTERVFHVDTKAATASDTNPGTKENPWKTLQHAGKTAIAGDKIIIHPGIYRETLAVINEGTRGKPIIFSGTKRGDVVLDGSKSVTGWRRSKRDPRVWQADSKRTVRPWPSPSYKHIEHYSSADPRDLSVDGMPLFFVKEFGEIRPGCWFVGKNADELYVRLPNDDDPNQHDMTVVALPFGVILSCAAKDKHLHPQFVTISNLCIRRYQGGIHIKSPENRIENNIIEWCGTWGMHFFRDARDSVFRNNDILWSGHKGAAGTHRIRFLNNRIYFSNWKLGSPGWDASGIKALYVLDALYEGNEVAYNGSLGIWLDTGMQGTLIKNNIVHDNLAPGLEDEANNGNTWEGNVSYRNQCGFYCGNSANDRIANNIFADNVEGVFFRFNRRRRPNQLLLHKLITKGSSGNNSGDTEDKTLKEYIHSMQPYHSTERLKRWLDDLLKYGSPCNLVRDNQFSKNLFMNNGVEVVNRMIRNLPDRSEAYLISNNLFDNNVFVNAKMSDVFKGYRPYDCIVKTIGPGAKKLSLKMTALDDREGKNLYLKKMMPDSLPDWARPLYEKYRHRLKYPHPYMSKAIRKIYGSLAVRNPHVSNYRGGPTPAGLLAVARMCKSNILKKIPFSDPQLHAYRIRYDGKACVVMWREHGTPSDFLPILLKGVPEDVKLETSWGPKQSLPRKNDLVSVNVGTWPVYLVNCPGDIREVPPFSLKIPEAVSANQPLIIQVRDAIADGKLFIDVYGNNVQCPREITITNGQGAFEIMCREGESRSIRVRLAGNLGGLYSGRFVHLYTGKVSDVRQKDVIKMEGFRPIPIEAVSNCSLKNNAPNELLNMQSSSSSLMSMPEKVTLGKITFRVNKNACIGLACSRAKVKRPTMISLPMGNRKYRYLAFLHVLSYAPPQKGIELLEYRLNYSDNFTASANLKNQMDIFDWWYAPNDEDKNHLQRGNSFCVWSGDNGNGHTVYVYAYIWENPDPHKKINSIDICGGDPNQKSTLGVLSISGMEHK